MEEELELFEVAVNPTVVDALGFIKKFHVKQPGKTLLVLVGNCMVDYHGRARSFLDWGERVVLVKQDGTVLVHQPTLREPVNWQPSGSKTEFKTEGCFLVLRSYRIRPGEKIKVVFRKVKMVCAGVLNDHATLVISGMESDIVNEIINNPSIIEEGLRVCKREKHLKSGIADLFCYDKNHVPVVVEVKRSVATISSVHQLRLYVSDVKRDVKEARVRGILCAPRVPDMVKKLLSEYGLEWREVERHVVLPDDFQKTLEDF
ncbi:MAG TPA: DUF91 domain-containing protein [Thermoplasmata archaeon]|nr:DUF91 domain-containing protein [Thermoplasmata archaeon]